MKHGMHKMNGKMMADKDMKPAKKKVKQENFNKEKGEILIMAMRGKMEKKKVAKKAPTKKAAAKTGGLTAAQKKLPPFIQAAIAKKKK